MLDVVVIVGALILETAFHTTEGNPVVFGSRAVTRETRPTAGDIACPLSQHSTCFFRCRPSMSGGFLIVIMGWRLVRVIHGYAFVVKQSPQARPASPG